MYFVIKDILKHTDKNSSDHAALQEALDKIKAVMTFINDDKRKTEAKLKLFEIHNDIENCPVRSIFFIILLLACDAYLIFNLIGSESEILVETVILTY